MARLILKSPYIKSTGGASGYLRYIATRERVELIPDDRPPTRKQEQLAAKLVKDFPDSKTLYEYEDYLTKPTKVSASAFITLALEANWDAIHESEQYMKYIATRPRAERIGAHGLFGDDDAVSLEKAMAELERYTGNVWTHIISLKREDAARLGFDNATAWRNLIRAHRNEMNVAPSKKVHYTIATAHADTFARGISFFKRLASASDVTVADANIPTPDGSIEVVTHAARVLMPLAELVDFEKELARIAKEKANAEKQLAGIENKLSNQGFIAKAPEAVVNGAREDAAKLRALIEKLDASAAAMKK